MNSVTEAADSRQSVPSQPNPAALGEKIAADTIAALSALGVRITLAELAGIMTAALVEVGITPASDRCTTYGWCKETGAHDLCWSKSTELPSVDGYREHPLPVHLLAVEGEAPQVGFLDLDLTPDQARERAREISRHMGEVLALADIAEGVAPLEPAAESYSVTATGATGAILNAELFTSDPENPADRVTKVSVWTAQDCDADLDVAGADELIADLEEFLPRLQALRNRVAELNAARGRA